MRFNVKIIVLKYLVCFTCLTKACLFPTLLDNELSAHSFKEIPFFIQKTVESMTLKMMLLTKINFCVARKCFQISFFWQKTKKGKWEVIKWTPWQKENGSEEKNKVKAAPRTSRACEECYSKYSNIKINRMSIIILVR